MILHSVSRGYAATLMCTVLDSTCHPGYAPVVVVYRHVVAVRSSHASISITSIPPVRPVVEKQAREHGGIFW
jgi:hypothetical protein